jgi:hypothetical protein
MKIARHYREDDLWQDLPVMRAYFLKLFKSKRKKPIRSGALEAGELKKQIIALGRGRKINITRLAYDGTPEDPPIAVKIIDIGNDHFTGKVINIERTISESQDEKLIYLKGGGGTIDFNFTDGDIIKVEEDIDEEIVKQRNVDEIKEILDALDLNEDINISYYDKVEGAVINGTVILNDKNMETLDFTITLRLINEIELKNPREVQLNLSEDEILDLEVVI